MKIYEYKLTPTMVCETAEPSVTNSPQSTVDYMQGAFDQWPEQEQFWVILLDRKNRPKGRIMVTLGTVGSCLAHSREVFRPAIIGGASAIICVHNHPSGDPVPSGADMQMTRQLRDAAKVIDIVLHDHVIIGRASADPMARGWYSFREAGLI
jgi:DNA repair protein RadC